ncbi:hypothetical protein HN954_01305 [bacterium]|jgi:hypothetical protein|nr:hypothetical protein [bacterium]MBT6831495.1 hypothetical protein [bacterium]MBT6996049.1 hypothetical protein [bacterium]MBT7772170.1 hypothetical protein [bacterium]
MKFLRSRFCADPALEKYIFQEDLGASEESQGQNETSQNQQRSKTSKQEREASVEEKIENLLKNPLKFSTRHLDFLEKNFSKLSDKQKVQFRDLVGYYLSVARKSGVENVPPRILALVQDFPKLRNLISPQMRREIDQELDTQVRDLKSISQKNPAQWSTLEGAKICTLYKRLQKKFAVGKQGALTELFLSVEQKLVEHTVNILSNYKTVGGKIVEVIQSGDKQKPITMTDRVLALEIRRLFPSSDGWGSFRNFEHWNQLAAGVTQEIFDPQKQLDANPELLATWELVAEFLENESDEILGTKLSPEKKEKLERFVERGNAVQFLQFASRQQIFLPTHVRSLQAILAQPDKLLFEKMPENSWQDFHPLAKEIHEKGKKIQELKDEQKQVESVEVQKFLTEHPENDNAAMYRDAAEKQKKTVSGFWDEFFSDEKFGELLKQWGDNKKHETAQTEKLAEMRKAHRDGDLKAEELQTYETNLTELQRRQTEYLTKSQEKFEEFRQKISQTSDDDAREKLIEKFSLEISNELANRAKPENFEKEVPWILHFREKFEAFKTDRKKSEDEMDLAKQAFPFAVATKSQIDKIETERKELEKDRGEKMVDLKLYEDWKNVFENPEKRAHEIQDSYFSALQKRVETHSLHAADFSILWDEELAAEMPEKFSALHGLPNWEKIQNFREKFSAVVDTVFDGISLPAISDSDDKFAPWYAELDEKLSYENLIDELREQGIDLKKEFPESQQLAQVLEGSLGFFRDDILEKLRPHIATEDWDDFVTGWNRIHRGLYASPQNLDSMNGAYSQQAAEKKDFDLKIEDAHEKQRAHIFNLEEKAKHETDPAKKQNLLDEAARLDAAFQFQLDGYRSGRNISEITSDGEEIRYWAPGRELIQTLGLHTDSLAKSAKKLSENFTSQFSRVGDLYKAYNAASGDEKIQKKKDAERGMREILADWPGTRSEFEKIMNDMRGIVRELVPEGTAPENFIEKYFQFPENALEEMDSAISEIRAAAPKQNFEFSGQEPFWTKIPKQCKVLLGFLNFRNGDLAALGKELDTSLEGSTKAAETLERLDFFDDQSPDKDEFRARFQNIAAGYKKSYFDFEKNLTGIKSRVENDERILSEDDFYEKYGLDSTHVQEIVKNHVKVAKQLKQNSERFLDSKFLDRWLSKYDESPETRAEALDQMAQFDGIGASADLAKEQSGEFKKWIDGYEEWMKKPTSHRTFTRFSIYSIIKIVQDAVEVNDTRFKRREDKSVGALGTHFFGKESVWGKEFHRRLEDSEGARIKEFESQYHDQEGWSIKAQMYNSSDEDEVRACINLLNEKGFLKWDDPQLWRVFERLQGKPPIETFPAGTINLTYKEILDKVRNAAEFIWSKEVFREWETTLSGKLKTVTDSYEEEFTNYEDDKEARDAILSDMLRRWKRGETTNVDPGKYEAFIKHAFTAGKMNGQPDRRFWFLIQGATCLNAQGEPLLSRNAVMRMNKDFLYFFPHVDFFTDGESPKKDGRIVPEGTPGAHGGGWLFEDYLEWGKMLGDAEGTYNVKNNKEGQNRMIRFFYEIAHSSPTANSRVRRAVRSATAKFDHDDAQAFSAEFTANDVAGSLNMDSSQKEKMTKDFWRNFLDGYRLFFEQQYEIIRDGDAQYGDAPGWQAKKNNLLEEVGSRLRASFIAIQTLLGNRTEGNHGSTTFEDDEWNFNSNYSQNAAFVRDMVHDFVGDFLDAGNLRQEYGYLLTTCGKKSGWNVRQGNDPRVAKARKNIDELVDGEAGDTVFRNKDLIWKNLDKMYHAGRFSRPESGGGKVVKMETSESSSDDLSAAA